MLNEGTKTDFVDAETKIPLRARRNHERVGLRIKSTSSALTQR